MLNEKGRQKALGQEEVCVVDLLCPPETEDIADGKAGQVKAEVGRLFVPCKSLGVELAITVRVDEGEVLVGPAIGRRIEGEPDDGQTNG